MNTYIQNSALKAQKDLKDRTLFSHIHVQITDKPPDQVSINSVLEKVKETIPKHLLSDLETIYVGNFKMLDDRQVDSMYVSGAILVSSKHESNEALYDTLVHEFAHAAEELARDQIYGDGLIAREFLGKRKTLYMMLKDDYEVDKNDFMNIEFSYSFDNLLNKEIGYDNMGPMTSGLFLSPYGATSLREYFANAFEHIFSGESHRVQEISPIVYKKIRFILNPRNL
jgi:hypothetical protein